MDEQVIPSSPAPVNAYTFDSAPEVPVFVNAKGHITIAGRTLACSRDAIRAAQAILAAYSYSQSAFLFSGTDY